MTAMAVAGAAAGDGCFKKITSKEYIHLGPKHLGDVKAGIKDHLAELIGSYIGSLGGVPVAHEDPRLEVGSGAISGDSPFIHFYVSTNYTVFSPEAGQQLLGEVNKVTSDHIGLLVYDTFNASVSKECISTQYEYDAELGRWCDRDFDNPVIEVGSTVQFTVFKLETLGDKLSIKGTLAAPNTGPVNAGTGTPTISRRASATSAGSPSKSPAAPTASATPDKDKKKKKKKRKRDADDVTGAAAPEPPSMATATVKDESSSASPKKKKAKSKEFVDDEGDNVGADADADTQPAKKKKKKKKKKEPAPIA